MKTLVLGGVRSGKSRMAADLATGASGKVAVFATAQCMDEEMRARIEAHRRARSPDWRVVEEPVHLASALRNKDGRASVLLVDCLTLWLSNLLWREDDELLETERSALLGFVDQCSSELIMVSNETNLGVAPMGALSRRFCDEAGALHQALARRCDRVIIMLAGLPQVLKGQAVTIGPG